MRIRVAAATAFVTTKRGAVVSLLGKRVRTGSGHDVSQRSELRASLFSSDASKDVALGQESSSEWELPACWRSVLDAELSSPWFSELREFVEEERRTESVYPRPEDTFRALRETAFEDVKVVIVGQDPYHGAGQAQGLAFSVPSTLRKLPPSLKNILKELADDEGGEENLLTSSGDLSGWASQGVLLLNTILTVRAGSPASHANRGWERLTDAICDALADRDPPVVFLLWGAKAKAKAKTAPYRLEALHPSPLSAHRGFFKSKPFSTANRMLKENLNQPPIDWISSLKLETNDVIIGPPEEEEEDIRPDYVGPLLHGRHAKFASAGAWRRIDLTCPYRDKDICKARGGHWDPNAKTWYISVAPTASLLDVQRDFARWLPPPTATDDDLS